MTVRIPAFLTLTDQPGAPTSPDSYLCSLTVEGATLSEQLPCGFVDATFDLTESLAADEQLSFTISLPQALTTEQEEMFLDVADPASTTPFPTA